MSATDTSQSSSGFLRTQRPTGESELNAWTQGLGGAPRPNPVAPSPIPSSQGAPQGFPSSSTPSSVPGSSLGSSTAASRYSSLNPNVRYDQKPPAAFQQNGINPFLSSPSLGSGLATEIGRAHV